MNNQGFSLLEIVVACLLFSVSVVGLFNVQRFLYQQFFIIEQQQQRLSAAHQILASYPQVLPIADNQFTISLRPTGENNCQIVTVKCEQLSLSRWYCASH